MRSSTLIKAVGLCFALAFLFSCGPKKRVVSSKGIETRVFGSKKTAVLRQVAHQQLQYTTFSGRAKSNLLLNGKDRYDVTANIRIVRDEAVWISITALMGVEVARLLITPDSIKIINRLEAEYTGRPLSHLHAIANSGLGFTNLQQLLTGDVISQLVAEESEVWQGASGYLLQEQTDDVLFTAQLGVNYQNNYTLIAHQADHQQLELFYSDYQSTADNAFPHRVDISITTPNLTLQAEMRYSRVVYDEKTELPFSVPAKYTEVQ